MGLGLWGPSLLILRAYACVMFRCCFFDMQTCGAPKHFDRGNKSGPRFAFLAAPVSLFLFGSFLVSFFHRIVRRCTGILENLSPMTNLARTVKKLTYLILIRFRFYGL